MYNYGQFPYQNFSLGTPVEIPHVNGINGANAYTLPACSSILLLDDNSPLVYLVKTDSAGYKTVTPYSITEYKPAPPVDVGSLLERVEALEKRFNDESNIKPVKPE